jgi:hypothetical protein
VKRDSTFDISKTFGLQGWGLILCVVVIRPERLWDPPRPYTIGTMCLRLLKRAGRGVEYPLYLAPKLKKE